jgi:hypothetical protein
MPSAIIAELPEIVAAMNLLIATMRFPTTAATTEVFDSPDAIAAPVSEFSCLFRSDPFVYPLEPVHRDGQQVGLHALSRGADPHAVAGGTARRDVVQRFGEKRCRHGILGQLSGTDLMPMLLNAADRFTPDERFDAVAPSHSGAHQNPEKRTG